MISKRDWGIVETLYYKNNLKTPSLNGVSPSIKMNKLMEVILLDKKVRNSNFIKLLIGSLMSAGSPWSGKE
ncbi:MAG: hypothetical protein WCX79_03545 [Candidatus Paceibacterota bacterium]|jgi:hypothetical protein